MLAADWPAGLAVAAKLAAGETSERTKTIPMRPRFKAGGSFIASFRRKVVSESVRLQVNRGGVRRGSLARPVLSRSCRAGALVAASIKTRLAPPPRHGQPRLNGRGYPEPNNHRRC